ncbi:TolC family protein [Labilibaculum sp. DW002]|uniref:TolC family protein n=1 Tax=Paralabilibaculum antarcticum TaxID=2912572 RepID=A0ABT5VR94_9BACT|nr:TolC family protein [Labilibaculum sp. DW002]MDE5417923.1 TolC family protein [Labilibaculum sp. DW002]
MSLISVQAQKQNLTLNQVLDRAQSNSLDAFLQKNTYLASRWEYKAYVADGLPSLSLTMNPFNYNRSFTERYNSVTELDEYKEQQSLYSYANMTLSQNIKLTGGTIYIDSDLGRLESFGASSSKSYSSTFVRVGLSQPLFGFNEFKWESKLEPLKFEIAKKEYLLNLQNVNVTAVGLFFDQVLAQLNVEMDSSNQVNAFALYEMGKKRFKIAAIRQNDLLNLELNVLKAKTSLAKSLKELQQTKFDLNVFLDYNENESKYLVLPDAVPEFIIDVNMALELAFKNHLLLLEEQQNIWEADMEVDEAKKARRFQADLVVSYGLNQESETFKNAYQDPINQQKVQLSLEIPLLDWGKRKGTYKMAQSDREVIRLSSKQKRIDFKQDVSRKVIDFNLQRELVYNAQRADEIAGKSYRVTLELFKEGKASVLQLDDALNKHDESRVQYITSLKNYWEYYYTIQMLTFYDFRSGKLLEAEFNF